MCAPRKPTACCWPDPWRLAWLAWLLCAEPCLACCATVRTCTRLEALAKPHTFFYCGGLVEQLTLHADGLVPAGLHGSPGFSLQGPASPAAQCVLL